MSEHRDGNGALPVWRLLGLHWLILFCVGLGRVLVQVHSHAYVEHGASVLALWRVHEALVVVFGGLLVCAFTCAVPWFATRVSRSRSARATQLLGVAMALVGPLVAVGLVAVDVWPLVRASEWYELLRMLVGSDAGMAAVFGVPVLVLGWASWKKRGHLRWLDLVIRLVGRSQTRTVATVSLVASVSVLLLLVLVLQPASDRPNVVLVSVDTLRADHLSSYGYDRLVSPNMDRLAAGGVLYERALSQAPWTLPSMATVHTSLYPSEHGAFSNELRMGNGVFTLAERFRNARYTTIGIVSHTFVDQAFGFAQGFDVFDRAQVDGLRDSTSEGLTDSAISYLRQYGERSVFLWVHYFDPHFAFLHHEQSPYGEGYTGELPEDLSEGVIKGLGSEPASTDVQYIEDRYDGEIAFTDRHIGRLLDAIDELGLEGRTIVALTGDHGEQFFERGTFGHGRYVYDELVHVPLVVRDPTRPELAGSRVTEPVETRDIGRTLAIAAGLEDPLPGGVDLLAMVEGPPAEPRYLFTEGTYAWGTDDRRLGVVSGDWKLIENLDDGSLELYDLAADAGERQNRQSDGERVLPELTEALRAHRERVAGSQQGAVRAHLGDDEKERLRALGYME